MLKLYLKELLQAKGYEARQKDLMEMGFVRFHAKQLLDEDMKSIKLEHLFLLCARFNCTPDDLFNFVPGKSGKLPEDHQLWSLRKDLESHRPAEELKMLSLAELMEVSNYLKSRKGK